MAVLPPAPPSYFPPESQPTAPPPKGNGMAIAGMVLGILALVLCWVMLVNFVLGALGIIFGALGIARANKIGGTGKGMALAGVITGIIGIIAGILFVVFVVAAFKDYAKKAEHISWRMTKHRVDRIANEGYPSWAMANPNKQCPDSPRDLAEYTLETSDQWGHEYKIFCGANLPPGAKGLAVMSLGEDGIEGTADDIKSWEPLRD